MPAQLLSAILLADMQRTEAQRQAERFAAEVLVARLEDRLALAGTPGFLGLAPYSIAAGLQGAWRAADQLIYQRMRAGRR